MNHLAGTTNCTADAEVNHPHAAADTDKALHHTISILSLLKSKIPMQHIAVTQMRNRQNPEEDAPLLTLTSTTSVQQNQKAA